MDLPDPCARCGDAPVDADAWPDRALPVALRAAPPTPPKNIACGSCSFAGSPHAAIAARMSSSLSKSTRVGSPRTTRTSVSYTHLTLPTSDLV